MFQTRLTKAAHAAALIAAVAFSTLCTLAAAPAQAAAPQVKTQAPGYYRLMLGDFEITALNDGTIDLPVDKILKQPAARTDVALRKAYQGVPLETSVNAFLVNTGTKLVLVDTGTGGAFGPTAGVLLANLKAAGYTPDQVDDIVITHDHPDHVGGLSRDGVAQFPNAVVHVGKGDAPHYLDAAAGDKAAFAAAAPYVASGRFKTIDADGAIVPGVASEDTHGHTPGHTSVLVESRGAKLVVTGDLIHVAAVQFDDPTVTVSFDADGRSAEAARLAVFRQAAKDGTLIAAAHLPFPGIGHLRANGAGFRFLPVDYARVK